MPSIRDNINAVRQRVQQAVREAGRNLDDILLLAASKTKSLDAIREAQAAGLTDFGENYLQEAVQKIDNIGDDRLLWHFIGPLQSNKTRTAAEYFDWVHSVDRLKIAQRLSSQRPSHLPPLNICLQVNIDDEQSKSGFPCTRVSDAALEIMSLPGIKLRGLMAIPRARDTFQAQCEPFRQLRELLERINEKLDNDQKLDTLSMGMSADLEAAIAEGATIVRVGSDIFGARTPSTTLTPE